jgi:hypothetical protein
MQDIGPDLKCNLSDVVELSQITSIRKVSQTLDGDGFLIRTRNDETFIFIDQRKDRHETVEVGSIDFISNVKTQDFIFRRLSIWPERVFLRRNKPLSLLRFARKICRASYSTRRFST